MKLWGSVAATTVASMAALAPAANASTVCNEAENSPQGGYVVTGGIVDPNPPAFLRDVTQMSVGNDEAAGLEHAADRSPALRQCAPEGSGETGGGAT
jgi:hypothetical protein